MFDINTLKAAQGQGQGQSPMSNSQSSINPNTNTYNNNNNNNNSNTNTPQMPPLGQMPPGNQRKAQSYTPTMNSSGNQTINQFSPMQQTTTQVAPMQPWTQSVPFGAQQNPAHMTHSSIGSSASVASVGSIGGISGVSGAAGGGISVGGGAMGTIPMGPTLMNQHSSIGGGYLRPDSARGTPDPPTGRPHFGQQVSGDPFSPHSGLSGLSQFSSMSVMSRQQSEVDVSMIDDVKAVMLNKKIN